MIKQFLGNTASLIAPKWAAKTRERLWLAKQAKLLRQWCEQRRTLEEIVDKVLQRDCFFRPSQKRHEILSLLHLLKEARPQYLCEIGAATGGTLFLFCQVAAPNAKVLSIDIGYRPAQLKAYQRFARSRQAVTCLAADSHSKQTPKIVNDWLAGKQLDFLFVDGDHSFAGVSNDYRMYSPLVSPSGLIGFHDIIPDFKTRFGQDTGNDVGDVPAFWNQIQQSYVDTSELIQDPNQDGFGIGLLSGRARRPHTLNMSFTE